MRITRVEEDLHHCIALRIDPSTRRFACSIYETRPQVCRTLERASSACRGELATKAERPQRALVVLGQRAT